MLKKCLSIKLTKNVKDICNENYKFLKKEIKDPKRCNKLLHSCIGRISIVKMAIQPQINTDSMQCPIKSQCCYSKNRKLIFKIHMEAKKNANNKKKIFSKKEQYWKCHSIAINTTICLFSGRGALLWLELGPSHLLNRCSTT